MKYVKWIKWGILILAIFTIFFAYRGLYSAGPSEGQQVFFEITSQETFSEILAGLKNQNLIHNAMFAKLYARATGLDKRIKAGRFKLEGGFSAVKMLNFLAHPEYGEISVTIPEGYSVFDIDKKLTDLNLIQRGEFREWTANADISKFPFIQENSPQLKLEGYLFPDTYFVFAKNFDSADLGYSMLENFNKKVAQGLKDDLKKSKRTLREIVTMASILEKEARFKEDYPVVAGILWKRLDNNWPLQADATLLYGKSDRSISARDLREDSAHNTYTRLGLPQTPIGNPGITTIKAAISPSETEYWFYLTDAIGRAVYAKTNKEHEENKRKHL